MEIIFVGMQFLVFRFWRSFFGDTGELFTNNVLHHDFLPPFLNRRHSRNTVFRPKRNFSDVFQELGNDTCLFRTYFSAFSNTTIFLFTLNQPFFTGNSPFLNQRENVRFSGGNTQFLVFLSMRFSPSETFFIVITDTLFHIISFFSSLAIFAGQTTADFSVSIIFRHGKGIHRVIFQTVPRFSSIAVFAEARSGTIPVFHRRYGTFLFTTNTENGTRFSVRME